MSLTLLLVIISHPITTLTLITTLKEDENFSLPELGKNLTQRLKDPANQGPEILEDLQQYIGELYAVYEKVSTRDGEIIKQGVKEFDALNKSGNALHFRLDVDFRLLKEKYYWTYDDRVLHARDLFNETDILWNKLVDRVNYIRF